MKKILCRHRDEKMFELMGYGVLLEDYGFKVAVDWLMHDRSHIIHKKYLYILDENEKDGYKMNEKR
jgi:hypothetical protein